MNKLLTILTITSTLFSAHCVDKIRVTEQNQYDTKKMLKSSKIKNGKLRRCGCFANKDDQTERTDKNTNSNKNAASDKNKVETKYSNSCTIYIGNTDNVQATLEDDRVSNEQFSDKNDVSGDVYAIPNEHYYVISLMGARYTTPDYEEYSKKSKICTFKLSDRDDNSVKVDVYVRYGGTHQVPFLLYNDGKNIIKASKYSATDVPMKLVNMYSVCTYDIDTDVLYQYVSDKIKEQKEQKEREDRFNAYIRQYAASMGITTDFVCTEVDNKETNQQAVNDENIKNEVIQQDVFDDTIVDNIVKNV